MITVINDIKINYEIQGEGEPVLVLHGWGGCIDSMRPVINHLMRKFKVIAMDFPGHGKSDFPNGVWGVPEYTECVKEFLRIMNIEKTNVLAHSFGGRVTIMLSSLNPEMIDKIVLVDSGGLIPRRTIKYYSKVNSYKLMKAILKLFVRNKERYDSIIKKYRGKVGSKDYNALPENMKQIFVKIVNQDLKPYLNKIQSSVLLIWGENDKDTPVYMGKIMEAEIKDAGLVIMKDAGHFSYLDKRIEFNTIIDCFFGVK